MSSAKYGLCGILIGSFLVSLDAVALSPSLPTIEDALKANSVEAYWASVAYTLGAATFSPLFPAFSNAFGRRLVSTVALSLFLIGSVVCATAGTPGALLAGRVLQGIGGGGTVAMLFVVITDLFPLRQRPQILAINSIVWLLGLSIGPIMGGGFSANVSWRWIFWIVLPIDAIAMSLVGAFLKTPDPVFNATSSKLSRLGWHNIDYFGATLAVASLSSFLIPLTWAGTMYEWHSWHTLVPFILGILGLVGLVLYEFFIPKHPILPLSILNDRTVAISFIHSLFIGVVQFGLVFYLPLYYQVVKGYSPLISGVALLPETLLGGPAGSIAGLLISKTGRYKFVILIGWAILSLGCGILTLLSARSSVVQWIFLNVPAGIGIGIIFPATITAAQAPVEESKVAIASGLVAFARAVGQSIGIAVCNAIMSNRLRTSLAMAASESLRKSAGNVAKNFASLSLLLGTADQTGSNQIELKSAYVAALQVVWWLLCGVSCCSLLLTLFIQDVSLDRTQGGAGEKNEANDIEASEPSPRIDQKPGEALVEESFSVDQNEDVAVNSRTSAQLPVQVQPEKAEVEHSPVTNDFYLSF